MITVHAYQGKKVGVFGLGKAGDAAIASLVAGGAEVFAADDSEGNAARTAEKFPGITVAPFAQWPWGKLAALVLSPGVPLTHPQPHEVVVAANGHGCPVLGDIELLYLSCPKAKFVGITGTNGKSTTTTLVGHILKEAGLTVEVGGNLGTAALALAPLGKEGIYVLELSSYQLDLLHSARFHIGAFLNITPDHLDRHGDMKGYVEAKMHLFDRQEKQDVAIIAVDDGYTHDVANRLHGGEAQQVVRVSSQKVLQEGVYVQDGVLHDVANKRAFDLKPIATLTGAHNWQNAALAYAIAHACGVRAEAIYEAMKSFQGLRHRLQLAATVDGVRFINDSKATNADAASHALAPYTAIYWIAGGKAKAGGIESLEHYFPKVAHAFLIGAAEEDFARTLDSKVAYSRCGTLHEAVKQAAAMAFAQGREGAVVLLSPACASFDQWKSFEERGDAFCAQAEAIAAEHKGGKRHAS